MQPDLRCYYHPDREAGGQCDRCGDYLCVQCVREHEELQVCPQCLSDLTLPELPKPAQRACLLNLASIVVVILSLMTGMFELIVLELPIAVMAIVLARRKWKWKADAASDMQICIMSLSCYTLFFPVGLLLSYSLARYYSVPLFANMMCPVAVVVMLHTWAFWWAAVVRRVKPLWAVIVSFVALVGCLVLLGLGAFSVQFGSWW